MILTKTCVTIFERALTYIDALSVTAVLLIMLFLTYIFIRQRRKNR